MMVFIIGYGLKTMDFLIIDYFESVAKLKFDSFP